MTPETEGTATPSPAAPAGACARCRHPFALHSNGKTECKAFACTAGAGRQPCPEFLPEALPVAS